MASLSFTSGKKPMSVFSQAGLTDIILLLLIFFLLTSTFVTQFGIQVTLPEAQAGATMDDIFVTVSITKEGVYYVDQEPVAREELLNTIREARGTREAVVLRADVDATVGQFAVVANIARALDMRLLMATERERRR